MVFDVEYVTQRYAQLQGRLLPFAPVFLLSAAWRAGLFHLPGDDRPNVPARWFVLGLAIAVAASYPVGRWYENRFGPHPAQPLTKSPLPSLVAVIACLALAVWIQGMAHWPFSLPVATLGAAMVVVGVRHYPFRRHYLVVAALFIGYALLPAFGVSALARNVLFDLTIAVAIVVVAVGDHLLLTTTLHDVRADV